MLGSLLGRESACPSPSPATLLPAGALSVSQIYKQNLEKKKKKE